MRLGDISIYCATGNVPPSTFEPIEFVIILYLREDAERRGTTTATTAPRRGKIINFSFGITSSHGRSFGHAHGEKKIQCIR